MRTIVLNILLCLGLLFSISVYSQSENEVRILDSLKSITLGDYSDSLKIEAYLDWEDRIYLTDPRLGIELNQNVIRIIDKNLNIGTGYYKNFRHYLSVKSRCFNNIGLTQSESLQENLKAIENLNKSLSIAEYLNDSLQMSYAINNLGGIYKFEGWDEEAHSCFVRSLSLYDGDPESNAISYDNIGLYFNEVANYDSALFYYEKSRTICLQYEPSLNYARTLGNLASVYYNLGRYDDAIKLSKESLVVAEQLNFSQGIAFVHQLMAMAYFEKKNYSQAIEQATLGYNIALETGDLWNQEYCARELYKSYKARNNTAQSLYYHEIYFKLNDSLFNEEKQEELLRVDFQFQHEREVLEDSLGFEKDKILIQKNHDVAIQESTNRQNILIITSIAALIFGLIFYWSYRNKNRAKIKVEKAKEELAKEKREKELFIAQTTHEIRSPLHAISGNLELLKFERQDTKASADLLKAAIDSSDHMLKVVNDILDLSKMESGKIEIKPTAFAFRESLILALNSMRPLAIDKGLELDLIISSDLPVIIELDELRLKQVIINLLSNSIKFTETGYVELKVISESNQIKFEVSDTGIGIEESQLERVFKLYDQLEVATNKLSTGTGIGLAFSSEIIKLMGGELKVESELGKGSSFHFKLPLIESESVKHDGQEQLIDLTSRKVLIVDDNQMSLSTGLSMLSFLKAEPFAVSSAKELYAILEKDSFDIILMDISMPFIDGFEATKHVKNVLNIITPIVGISGFVDVQKNAKMQEVGILENLGKPFTLVQLSNCLFRVFPESKMKSIKNSETIDYFATFRQDVPEILKSAELAHEAKNIESLEFHIHKVKPCYFYIKEMAVFEFISKFEKEIHSLSQLEIKDRLNFILKETDRIISV